MTSLGLKLGLSAQRPLGGFAGPLDGYTAGLTVAWDWKRRLLSSYTGKAGLVRADRTGQPTYEIGFLANGSWDTAGLLSFAGSDTVYAVAPYEQGSGAQVFTQSTGSNQPVLVSGGVVNTDGPLFSAVEYFTPGSINALDVFSATQAQLYFRGKSSSNALNVARYFSHSSLLCYLPFAAIGNIYLDFPDRIQAATPGTFLDAVKDVSLEHQPATTYIRINGTTAVSGAVSNAIASNVASFRVGDGLIGNLSSCVIWNTCDNTLSAARSAALA
jgi:hypothetical protein